VNETLLNIPGNIQIVIRALPKVTEIEFSELSKIITEGITKSIVKANV
jgi:RNase P protein component